MNTLLHKFLKAAGVAFTESYADEVYMSEPKSNTLLGLKRMIHQVGVQTKAVRMENLEDLRKLVYPYILHVKDDFVIITQSEDLSEKILKAWDGIVLYITDKNLAKEPSYGKHKNHQIIKNIVYYFLLFLPILFLIFSESYLLVGINYLFILLGILGMFLGGLLLEKQLGLSTRFGNRICQMFQKQGCENVLSSKHAKIGGILSLSEIGFGYFWAQLMFLGLCPLASDFIYVFAVIGMLFPIWSIYSQARMHHWCGLCLLTMAVLFLQGLFVICQDLCSAGILLASLTLPLFLVQLFLTGLILLGGIIGAHIFAEAIRQKKAAQFARRELRFTMRHREVFQALMQHAELHEYQPSDVVQTFGNPEAEHRIGIFWSENCKHCQELKPQLDFFIQNNGSIFAIDLMNIDARSAEEQQSFQERTGLISTPTILLDYYKIPVQSELSDLEYII